MLPIPRDILIGFILVCIASWAIMDTRTFRFVDRNLYDEQVSWLRQHYPTPLAQDVVVIGFDEAAYESIAEPTALWHRQLGTLLTGLAAAKPAIVGLAMPLPVRSYDFLVDGIDVALLAGLARMREAAPFVAGQPLGIGGKLRPISPHVAVVIGDESIASLAICEDIDGVVRRLNQTRCRSADKREPLAMAMARRMGRQGNEAGMIDFTVGSEIEYTPVTTVLGWIANADTARLDALVRGRAVIIANLLPTEKRHRMPVALTGWEPGSRTDPAAVTHVQALRSLLTRGLIERLPDSVPLALAALAVLFWFGRSDRMKVALLLAFVAALIAGSTFVLWHGSYLRVANVAVVALMAIISRQAWDYARTFHQRQSLRHMFAGHVSPRVMRAILGGEVAVAQNGQRSNVTLMHVGIRGFGERSARSTPEAMVLLLNRFHEAASTAILESGGAVDRMVGDGLLATFGLPQSLAAPSRNALEAAQHLLLRVDRLNTELAAEGIEPLRIGIGLHVGEVLSGFVGPHQRRDFSVIGNAVGVAARLEALTKEHPHPVICSHEVAAAVNFTGGMVDLGMRPEDLHIWGWTPPLTTVPAARAGAAR